MGTPLRVVMVVANDVTRDSRVLREASALAAAGHEVTVLGILTAASTAPIVEHVGGFTIRRLAYRARPPRWWVPVDFSDSVRRRALRVSIRTRARVTARRRRWSARFARVGHQAARVAARVERRLTWRRSRRLLTTGRHERHMPRSGTIRIRPVLRRLRRGVVRGGREAIEESRAAAKASRAAIGVGALLGWGTMFRVADRATGGAIGWLTAWRWRWLGWAEYVARRAPPADVWHAHDLPSLPAAVLLKHRRGGAVVYDSHEIYVESGVVATQPVAARRRLAEYERRLVRQADAIITVNRSLAVILGARLRVKEVTPIYNCPPRHDGVTAGSRLHDAFAMARDTPLILYHGSLSAHRGIEQLLDAIRDPRLADVHLGFLGYGPLRDWLRHELRDDRYGGRVHLHDGVPPNELIEWLEGVDVSVVPIQPSTLNHRYSSPNKVFEAIAAGVPVAGSDFREFREVILGEDDGPLGVLFDPTQPAAIAEAVRSILDLDPDARRAIRDRCWRAARRRWNWESESTKLVEVYERIGSRPASGAWLSPVA